MVMTSAVTFLQIIMRSETERGPYVFPTIYVVSFEATFTKNKKKKVRQRPFQAEPGSESSPSLLCRIPRAIFHSTNLYQANVCGVSYNS